MTEREIKYPEIYYPVFAQDFKVGLLWGGRSAGRSVIAARKTVIFCESLIGQCQFLAIRQTYNSVTDSSFAELCAACDELGFFDSGRAKQYASSIVFANGCEIRLAGLSNPESLKSIKNLAGFWLEEGQLVTDSKALDKLYKTVRYRNPEGKSQSMILCTMNRIMTSDVAFAWFKSFSVKSGFLEIYATIDDNPLAPELMYEIREKERLEVQNGTRSRELFDLEWLGIPFDGALSDLPSIFAPKAIQQLSEIQYPAQIIARGFGVDVALSGQDRYIVTEILVGHDQQRYIGEMWNISGKDIDDSCGWITGKAGERNIDFIGVDADGQGISVYQKLSKSLKCSVYAFHGNDTSFDPNYANLRACSYGYFAQLASQNQVHVCQDNTLYRDGIQELTYTLLGRPNSAGLMTLADKSTTIRKIIGRSPDVGDSWNMGIWAARQYMLTKNRTQQGNVIRQAVRRNTNRIYRSTPL